MRVMWRSGDAFTQRTFRTIQVTVVAAGHGRLHVRTRSGYAVPGNKGQKDDKDTP